MPMGPDPNPNTASAIGPATVARLEHGPLETHRRPEGIRGRPAMESKTAQKPLYGCVIGGKKIKGLLLVMAFEIRWGAG